MGTAAAVLAIWRQYDTQVLGRRLPSGWNTVHHLDGSTYQAATSHRPPPLPPRLPQPAWRRASPGTPHTCSRQPAASHRQGRAPSGKAAIGKAGQGSQNRGLWRPTLQLPGRQAPYIAVEAGRGAQNNAAWQAGRGRGAHRRISAGSTLAFCVRVATWKVPEWVGGVGALPGCPGRQAGSNTFGQRGACGPQPRRSTTLWANYWRTCSLPSSFRNSNATHQLP